MNRIVSQATRCISTSPVPASRRRRTAPRTPPIRRVEHERKRREAIADPREEKRRRHGMAQEPGEMRDVQPSPRARDRERKAGAEECARRVAGEVGEARDPARLVELGELDREREAGRDQRCAEHRERGTVARGEKPGEAGAERQVQEDVRGDVAARRAGMRQFAEALERARAREREAEGIERAERDQEHDDREQPAGDPAVVRDHALTRAGPSAAGRGSPRRAGRGSARVAGVRARARRARRARGS